MRAVSPSEEHPITIGVYAEASRERHGFTLRFLARGPPRLFVPVIVTTGQVVVREFEIADVCLADGKLAVGESRDVPWIVFHKTLAFPDQ